MPCSTESLEAKLAKYAHKIRITNPRYNEQLTPSFHPLIVRDAIRSACINTVKGDYTSHPRWAFVANGRRYDLHPAVEFIYDCMVLPVNWHLLALEWPHRSESDPTKVAYTRHEVDATRTKLPLTHPRYNPEQKHTVTTVQKYIKRHWPQLPDHLIQEINAKFNQTIKIKHTDDYREMITIMGRGPRSCMTVEYGTIPFNSRDQEMALAWYDDRTSDEPDWDKHPYTVYRGENGWSLYYRLEDNEVVARALVYKDPDDSSAKPCWVRTYHDGGRDTFLEQWFDTNGFVRKYSWPSGARLEAVSRSGSWAGSEYMMPYIDGDDRTVEFCGDYFITGGDLSATETRGWIDVNNVDWECSDCGEGFSDDDDDDDEGTTVGRHEDVRVCSHCLDNYTFVRGRSRWGNYREYYVNDDYSCIVDDEGRDTGDYIDDNNPPANYVSCYDRHGDGAWAHIGDVVSIDGEYWPCNHRDVVSLNEPSPDGDDYALVEDTWTDGDGAVHHDDHEHIMYDGHKWMKDDAWQCEATGLWYPEHVDQAIDPVTGDTVHPEYLEPCNRDADFIIVYGDEKCNALPHIHVPTNSALVFDAVTSEVFDLAA